jgi:methyl-accepting chemotaxis protein
MPRLTISRLLILFGSMVTLGLAVSIGLQTLALTRLKVGGPVYLEIEREKDLIADVLPPPLFLVEAYSLASEAVIHTELLDANAKTIGKLKEDYVSRLGHWRGSDLPPDIKSLLSDEVAATADRFWSNVEGAYLPAVAKKDEHGLHAALDHLKDDFHAHEAAVRKLVAQVNILAAKTEEMAAAEDARMSVLAMSGSAGSVVVFLLGLWALRRRAILPLTSISRYMGHLAKGDYTRAVPFMERSDEIGRMAGAVEVFRTAALDRIQLRSEMERERQQSEQEKAAQDRIREREAQDLKVVVDALGAGLGRLADCNIRITIDEPFADRFESLRHDFNNSIAAFQSALEEVLSKTAHLSDNSHAMREAADNLSKRTEQQAAALEQTAASLEEVTSTVRSSVGRTAETRELVKEARECTVASGAVVNDAVNAMKRIETASSQIDQIITVIDEIAFQTNLLALNAGVEAARAGEAGKGFAVVATEVRELAQRSAKAAKEIGGLIANSSKEVADGVKLVSQTGTALERIAGFVSEIDGKVEAITTASREQSVGLNEISSAVNALDQMTQQNASMVEETTAISHSLSLESQALTELVGRFKLNRRAQIRDPNTPHHGRRAA